MEWVIIGIIGIVVAGLYVWALCASDDDWQSTR
jgi:hypothetical protein